MGNDKTKIYASTGKQLKYKLYTIKWHEKLLSSQNPEVLSTGSPMTVSGDFGLSADFSKSGDYSESGDYSRGTSSSSPRTTFKNLKEKYA